MQIRSPKHKKVPVVSHITNMTGLVRLKCSSLNALWASSRIVSLSGDVEKYPGPTNQLSGNRNVNCLSVANPVSLLESRLSQIGRVTVDIGGAGDCPSIHVTKEAVAGQELARDKINLRQATCLVLGLSRRKAIKSAILCLNEIQFFYEEISLQKC